jgi:hypothetical protein
MVFRVRCEYAECTDAIIATTWSAMVDGLIVTPQDSSSYILIYLSYHSARVRISSLRLSYL